MPFDSKAQQRYLYAAEARGEVPKGTADKKGEGTNYKRIPEKVRKEAALILDRLQKRANQGTNTATRMVRKPAAPVSGKIPQPKQGSVAGPARSFKPQNSSQHAQ